MDLNNLSNQTALEIVLNEFTTVFEANISLQSVLIKALKQL